MPGPQTSETTPETTPDIKKLLRTPLAVTWVVTSRCNLDCLYCLEDATGPGGPDDVSEDLRALIVRELIACNVLKVYVSGGEPLLLDSVPDHVARLRERGIAVRLTTNGALVDGRAAGRLAASRVDVVEVSLHPGTAEAVVAAVSLLVEKRVRVIARVVVTRSNAGRLGELAGPLLEAGAESVSFQEVVPLGRAAGAMSEHGPDDETLSAVRRQVDDLGRRWGSARVGLTSATLSDIRGGRPTECGLGAPLKKSCEIRPDGNVVPCAPATVYGVTNFLGEKGLARAWRDLPDLYGGFAVAPLGGQCDLCLESERGCAGGCRAVSRLVTGEVSAGNPLCRFHRGQ